MEDRKSLEAARRECYAALLVSNASVMFQDYVMGKLDECDMVSTLKMWTKMLKDNVVVKFR